MNASQPKYIDRGALAELLGQEVLRLTGADLEWWASHCVAPYSVIHDETAHFVVASDGNKILFFADDEDEFGVAQLAKSERIMTGYGLIGDLIDAVRVIRTIVV
jgi:hypothetical protein